MATEAAAPPAPVPTSSNGLSDDGAEPAPTPVKSDNGAGAGFVDSDVDNNGVTSAPNSDSLKPESSANPNQGASDVNLETKAGESPDKVGDKIDNLNNLGADTGGVLDANALPNNSTNTVQSDPLVNDPKSPKEDPQNGVILPESQDVNQSSPSTKTPVVLTTAAKDALNPIREVTVGEPETTTQSTTQTTTETSTTTTTQQPTTASTSKVTTEPIIIEFPNSAKTEPPYAIVSSSSPTNGTATGPADPGSSQGTIIIASSVIGVLLLVILVVVLIIWLLRRRKRRSKQDIMTVENPRYNKVPDITRNSPPSAPHQYRFSRDADISIGQVRTGKVSNNNLKTSPMFGKKGMMSYSPAPSVSGSDVSGTGSRRMKRRAPPPPNPFGDPNFYERDSNGSGYEMTTFGNVSSFGKSATPSPKSENHEDAAAKEPLLNGKAGSKEPTKEPKKEPKRSGDYSSSSSSDSSDEEADTSEIQKAVDEKFQEHRDSHIYDKLNGEDEEPFEDYDQKLNPFSESWTDP